MSSHERTPARLVLQRPDGEELVYALDQGRSITLGRDAGNTIVLPSQFVSKRHALVSWTPRGVRIEDQDSANGIMGLESFIVASALRLVVAQRLVRRLCKECKVPLEIDVRTHPLTASYERLHQHGRVTIREPRGCPACGGAGYRGRTGIFEVLRISPAIEDLVMYCGVPTMAVEVAPAS